MNGFNVGLQLYTVRDEIEKTGLDEALGRVRDAGYDCVEFAGYYGFSGAELKEMLNKHGLDCVSVHQKVERFFVPGNTLLQHEKELGAKYNVIPWVNKEELMGEQWQKTKKLFADAGKLLSENGIKLYYHNHNFEFVKENGKLVYDRIFDELGLDVINPQIDLCWMNYAGFDPCLYLEKFKGHADLLHLKDYVCDGEVKGKLFSLIDDGKKEEKSSEKTGFRQTPVGMGVVDFEAILKAAQDAGTKYLIVENDSCPGYQIYDSVRMSREYLRSLGI